jgi:hypothetical protein
MEGGEHEQGRFTRDRKTDIKVELWRDPLNEENGKGSKRKPEKQNQPLPSMKLGHRSFPPERRYR